MMDVGLIIFHWTDFQIHFRAQRINLIKNTKATHRLTILLLDELSVDYIRRIPS